METFSNIEAVQEGRAFCWEGLSSDVLVFARSGWGWRSAAQGTVRTTLLAPGSCDSWISRRFFPNSMMIAGIILKVFSAEVREALCRRISRLELILFNG